MCVFLWYYVSFVVIYQVIIDIFVFFDYREKEADMNRRYKELNQELHTLVSIDGKSVFNNQFLLLDMSSM